MSLDQLHNLQSFDSQIYKLTTNVKAGGCAAKISASQLREIVRHIPEQSCVQLLTDIGSFEDAAVYKLSDEIALVQTIDFFPPMLDDPYLYGRIAAANALSDIYAMGATPILALNVFCFPVCSFPLSVAAQIIEGGAAACLEAGVALAGGHTIAGVEPLYGLSVTGVVHPSHILTNGGARAQDVLVLTKPIGTGVGLSALKGGVLSNQATAELCRSMTHLNAKALKIAQDFDIHGATDVTGFGLIGHLHEMARAAQLKFQLNAQCVPLLAQVKELAAQGIVPAGAYSNRASYESSVSIASSVELALGDLFFDPQTSGGLLLAVAPDDVDMLVTNLQAAGCTASKIGTFGQGQPGFVEVISE